MGLDSAMCSTQARSSFLALAYSGSIYNSSLVHKSSYHKLIWWSVIRCAIMDAFIVNSELDCEWQDRFLTISGSSIRSVALFDYRNCESATLIIEKILESCKKTENLLIYWWVDSTFSCDELYPKLASSFSGLKGLTIGCQNISINGLKRTLNIVAC